MTKTTPLFRSREKIFQAVLPIPLGFPRPQACGGPFHHCARIGNRAPAADKPRIQDGFDLRQRRAEGGPDGIVHRPVEGQEASSPSRRAALLPM